MKLYDAYKPLYQEKYPALYPIFLINMAHLMVSLYYDMWADENEYKKEQKEVYRSFKEHEKTMLDGSRLSRKEKLKFKLFSLSPSAFCIMHKLLHH